MENISSTLWPWLVLVVGLAGFVLGTLFGKERLLSLAWGGKKICNHVCSCGGANCNIPIGPNHSAHCERQRCIPGCNGFCTLNKGHAPPHSCGHGHTFP